ncbi:GntR family transcriptional regulator [Plastoroseomonas hellenica]|uniref:GntR family transcriptional regulator n=1 Tax=Plastoroseomonas hellenica TaxID=2687306 RepID=UPI001BAA92B2|nr:GntR family transcriptional regulator [Plastoroseomonas hellenica]MBR0643543.1 GntR family transcriptional regulator [Plastoroseomonas hellenica]
MSASEAALDALAARHLAGSRSMPDAVAEALRDGILTGLLPAGRQLKQDHLARRFGVSRAPVREALQILAGEGLLTVSRHRGVIVAPSDPADLVEIAELRGLLEGHALRLSGPRLSAADFEDAAALLDQAEAAAEPVLQAELHWRFHRALLHRAERPRILAQIEHLHIAVSRYLLPAWTAAGLSVGWVASHRDLLRLVRSGQVGAAAELNSSQIEEARSRVAAWLQTREPT